MASLEILPQSDVSENLIDKCFQKQNRMISVTVDISAQSDELTDIEKLMIISVFP